MRRFALLVLFGLLSSVGPVPAIAASDLRGQMALPDGSIVAPGSVARLVLTVTNLGPDATPGNPGMGTVFTPNVGSRNFAILRLPETAPCAVNYIDFVAPPGQLSTIGVSISVGRVLQPSESATCVVGLQTFPESPGIQAVGFSFGPISDDPDLSNNRVSLQVRTGVPPPAVQPLAVPAVSLSTLLFLALGVVGMAVCTMRRAS